MPRHVTVLSAAVALLLLSGAYGGARVEGQAPKAVSKILYVLPNFLGFSSAGSAHVSGEVVQLRQRFGEGRYVRLGFTSYVFVEMDNASVDPSDRSALRQALSTSIAQIDAAIERARANNIALCLSIVSPFRERYDPLQFDAERSDRRNMQWYMDNGMANGWVTHSRYARRFRSRQEAYVRELGAVVANRMARYPSTLVAGSGDGEIELSFERSFIVNPAFTEATSQLADYSPFAIAEFRDWLRNGGLYAPGQPYAGQGYEAAARYQGDASPAADTNGDGHTLNGDFGTVFTSWNLRYFDWSLDDRLDGDPNAIPAFVYEGPGFTPNPPSDPSRFDAPRVRQPGNGWWETWNLFRQVMVWHYNVDFARWMTTTVDPDTGRTLPVTRWFSHQIPADYLFGAAPENPNFRFVTSASAHWTADVTPYGGLGITSFNVNLGGGRFAVTARNVVPHIAARGVPWAILEWNPSVPVSNSLDVYEQEMAMVERYRPALLVPFAWGDRDSQIQNTPFEIALRDLIARIKDTPRPAATGSLVSGDPLFLPLGMASPIVPPLRRDAPGPRRR